MKGKMIIAAIIFLGISAGILGYLLLNKNGAVSLAQNSVEVTVASSTGLSATTTTAEAVIQFFGDVMLDRNVAKAMSTSGLDYIFAEAGGTGLFLDADLRVANLEGPFAPKRLKTTKSIAFRFDPALAPQLKKYGFELVCLANNHALDMGWANLTFTKNTLANAGINFFGNELYEGPQYTWTGQVNAYKMAFIGLNNTDHVLTLSKVKQAIAEAKKSADYVIIFMHWGTEYRQKSTSSQQKLGHYLIDSGADAVIGSHPHVVEEMEFYKEKPIFYSLGNFIFDQYFSKETQQGISVSLVFGGKGIKEIGVIPFYSEKSQPQLMTGREKEDFMEWFETNSRLGNKKFINNSLELY